MIQLLAALIFATSLYAKTEAKFVDSCNKSEIKVSNPNGTRLSLSLTDLDPNDDLEVTITYRPAGIVEDLKPQDQVIWNYNFRLAGKTFKTLLPIPKAKWMWQVEQRHAEYRIWDAEVRWVQPNARKTGSDVTTFYRAPDKGPFFQMMSEGLCQWEGSADVSSKLYENNTTTWMNVMRDRVQMWDQGNGPGIALGYNNNTGSTVPLSPTGQSNNVMGWVFKDWQKQLNSQQIFRYERKFVLNKEESGLFTSRMTFNRHEVRRFEWQQSGQSCGAYVAVSEGMLDIGQLSEDFVVLPKNFYPRPEKLKEYINTVRPPVNNCGDTEITGPQDATDILPSGADGILYYYQLTNNRGVE